jgi:hypothetical protein
MNGITEVFGTTADAIRQRARSSRPLSPAEVDRLRDLERKVAKLEACISSGIQAIGATLATAAEANALPDSENVADIGWLIECLTGLQRHVVSNGFAVQQLLSELAKDNPGSG